MANKKIALITGSTDGLGKQVAQDLADQNMHVLLHGRKMEKGESVLKEIQKGGGKNRASYYNADFASLDNVRQLGEKIQDDYDRIDLLINNAGIGFGKPTDGRQVSRDGYELRFQVNYLAGFLLTIQLLPLLKQGSPARIVNVASGAQETLDFDNLMLNEGYSGRRAYGQSKLAQILFTFELAERISSFATVNALHPATFMDTNLVRRAGIEPLSDRTEGAEAVEFLATSTDLSDVTGAYFNGKREVRAAKQAYDEGARQALWKRSEELTDITG